jgi:hypothetical protein
MLDTTLLLLVAFGFGAFFWSQARRAAEQARALGSDACRRAGVQLLDQSVSLHRVALRRGESGWLQLLREYRFDYSRDGVDRLRGSLALQGGRLLWITSPEPKPPPQPSAPERIAAAASWRIGPPTT